MVPTSFQTPRTLAVLNTGAVGLALAALVAPVFGAIDPYDSLGAYAGMPTLLCGVLWAWLLRRPQTVGRTSIRWGWVASIPLAMLNAGLSCGLLMTLESSGARPERFFGGMVLGATFGVIIWLPSLLATLLCFGVPIARAQRLAKNGLAGAEHGEWIVGFVCVTMSVVGLLLSLTIDQPPRPVDEIHIWSARLFGILGALAGASSTTLSWLRGTRRRAFVAAAEAGTVKGYRVDTTNDGKVLVRIGAQGQGYRVADFEEEVFELDAQGEALRPKHLDDVANG
ncbi:MAG: hypothetical protein ABI134_24245 [Byssovorax sp.]